MPLLPWRTSGEGDPCACCCRTKTIQAYKGKVGYATYVPTTPDQRYLTETRFDDATSCGGGCPAVTQVRTYDRLSGVNNLVSQDPPGCVPDMLTGGPGASCTQTLTPTENSNKCTTPPLNRCGNTLFGKATFNSASYNLSDEYTTARLIADADALYAACSFDAVDWGKRIYAAYDAGGAPDCSNVIDEPCDLTAFFYQDSDELWVQKQWLRFLPAGDSYCQTFTPQGGGPATSTTVACTAGIAVTVDPPATLGVLTITFGDCP